MNALESRVKLLESRVAKLCVMNVALVLGTAVMVCGALSAPPEPVPKTLTCSELRIVDAEGRLRIRAQAVDDGNSSVTWRDREGRVRIGAGTFDDGTAGLGLRDLNGKERVAMETLASGESTARWSDQSGKVRVGVGTFVNGSAAVDVLDNASKFSRIHLVTDSGGKAAAQFHDPLGAVRYATILEPDGMVTTSWYDSKGGVRVVAGVGPAATGEVFLPTRDSGAQAPSPKVAGQP